MSKVSLYRGMTIDEFDPDEFVAALSSDDKLKLFVIGQLDSIMRGERSQFAISSSESGGVGIHWSTDRSVSESFAMKFGKSLRIELFNGAIPLVISATAEAGDALDPSEIGFYGWNGKDEKEVGLKPGSTIQINSVSVLVPTDRKSFISEYDESGKASTKSVEWFVVNTSIRSSSSLSKEAGRYDVWRGIAVENVPESIIKNRDTRRLIKFIQKGNHFHWTWDKWTAEKFARSYVKDKNAVRVVLQGTYRAGNYAPMEVSKEKGSLAYYGDPEKEVSLPPGEEVTLTKIKVWWPGMDYNSSLAAVVEPLKKIKFYSSIKTSVIREDVGPAEEFLVQRGRPVCASRDEYGHRHQPPQDSPPLHDLTHGDYFPRDVYSTLHNYGWGEHVRPSASVIQRVQGQPDAMVSIYRSVPPNVDELVFHTGNWVAIAQSYADEHGRGRKYEWYDPDSEYTTYDGSTHQGEWVVVEGDWVTMEARVPAHTVRNGGNDIQEWGYWGPPVSGRVVTGQHRPEHRDRRRNLGLISSLNPYDEYARCTNAVYQAITGEVCPVPIRDGAHLLGELMKAGWTYGIEYPLPKTVRALVNDPKYSEGIWYFFTAGHAMAMIDGTLVDTEGRGADLRRIQGVYPIKRKAEAKTAGKMTPDQRYEVRPYGDTEWVLYDRHDLINDVEGGMLYDIGYLKLAPGNVIQEIHIDGGYRRKGLATFLFNAVQDEVGPLKHSDPIDMTPAGLEWSKSVGRVPTESEESGSTWNPLFSSLDQYRRRKLGLISSKTALFTYYAEDEREVEVKGGKVYISWDGRNEFRAALLSGNYDRPIGVLIIDNHRRDDLGGWGRKHPYPGQIEILKRHRRRGIATALWNMAKEKFPDLVHSHARSDDGKAWSRHVGSSRSSVPASIGETPLPQGTFRAYHWTSAANLDSILANGLSMSHSRGGNYNEPSGVWFSGRASDWGSPDYISEDQVLLEVALPNDIYIANGGKDGTFVTVEDIPASAIIAIHESWHQGYRYMDQRRDEVLAGKWDHALDLDQYRRGIEQIKREGGLTASASQGFRVARGLVLTLDGDTGLRTARKVVDGTVTANDIVDAVHAGSGHAGDWWGDLDLDWSVDAARSFAECEEFPSEEWLEHEIGGEIGVVLVGISPVSPGAHNEPGDHNQVLPPGTAVRLTEVHYYHDDRWRVLPVSGLSAVASSAGKPIGEMSESEFRSLEPRLLYHAASYERDLQTLLNEGVKMSNVPMNLARQRYQSGEYAEYSPGAGVGIGLYASASFNTAAGFGRYIIAIEVNPGDYELPPESSHDPYYKMEWALRDANGVLITKDIPASRVHLVTDFHRYESNDAYKAATDPRNGKSPSKTASSGQSSPGAQEIMDLAIEGALDNEARISVAENVMERSGYDGEAWLIKNGHVDDPAYKATMEPIRQFVAEVVGERVRVHAASDYIMNYEMHGAHAMVTGTGTMFLKPGWVSKMTVLHECAHLINRSTHGQGHDDAFIQIAADLYGKYIGPQAKEKFLDLAVPFTSEASASAGYVKRREGYTSDGVEFRIYSHMLDPHTEVGLLRVVRVGDDIWQITAVEVREHYQRQGIASDLLRTAREDLGTVIHDDTLSGDAVAWKAVVGSISTAADTVSSSSFVYDGSGIFDLFMYDIHPFRVKIRQALVVGETWGNRPAIKRLVAKSLNIPQKQVAFLDVYDVGARAVIESRQMKKPGIAIVYGEALARVRNELGLEARSSKNILSTSAKQWTSYPELNVVIDSYLDRIGNRIPADVHGMCQVVAENFAEFAKERGVDIRVTHTNLDEMGYKITGKPHGEIFDDDGNIVMGHYYEHTINEFYPSDGGWPIAIDFTALQYGYTDQVKIS